VRPISIGRPQKLSRTSASKEKKEVNDLTKARLISLLLIASLFAYILACVWGHSPVTGMSSGGGF
jgi:heme O synthase-like polyprenyltransferase